MENVNLTKELAPVKVQASKAENAANSLQINKAEDLRTATDLLGKIKYIGNEITEIKDSIAKPLNEALRNARAFFAPVENQWRTAEKTVKAKMVTYNNKQQEKARKKTEAIEKKVREGKMSFDKAADKIETVTPPKSVEGKTGASQFRTVRDVIITDETKLPRGYLIPNTVKIRKDALAGVNIAGVVVEEKQIVAGVIKQRNG